jgi:ABC-type Fe3+-hydroxamate transport system substrate-binding protein
MLSFTDPLGRIMTLPQTPQRIVSLVPSQTELLYSLGLDKEVVGITKFCVHPPGWFRTKTRIGGTKDVHLDQVHSLQPDLVLAAKEENDRQQVEELARHYPVWVSDVKTLPDALAMIRLVGELTGQKATADTLADDIARRFDELPPSPLSDSLSPSREPPRAAYFIWRNPWMVAGGDTFIHDMLQRSGFSNIFRNRDRYPAIDLASLAGSDCQYVLLSSEPYPFRERHIQEVRAILPDANIRLVDGELFSWYGSRLLHSPPYFARLLREFSHYPL